jgi:hypothetical protein
MFRYPKMPGPSGAKLDRCVAFEKLDGTNLFWEWHREFGWTDFGTRSASYQLAPGGVTEFVAKHPGLEEAPEVFATLGEQLHPVLAAVPDVDHAVAFTEFLGPHSFAGLHKPDDPKRLVLCDVFVRLRRPVAVPRTVRRLVHSDRRVPRQVHRQPDGGRAGR